MAMLPINIYPLGSADESLFTRVVMVSQYHGKWVYCKHKDRTTWEIPGGHIEKGETWLEAARRELYEETGATDADIEPICLYSISTYGILCYANIQKLEDLPNDFEMEKIAFFDEEPKELTYPDGHRLFLKTVREKKGL